MTAPLIVSDDVPALLDRLSAPILLVGADGAALHVNAAGRDLLQSIRPGCDGDLAAGARFNFPPGLTASLAEKPGAAARGLVGIATDAPGAASLTSFDARVSQFRDMLLVEGVGEGPERREIRQLTAQLAAMSLGGYSDVRLAATRKGEMLDVLVGARAQLGAPLEQLLERDVRRALPAPAGEQLYQAIVRFSEDEGGEGGNREDSALLTLGEGPDARFFEARLSVPDGGDRVLAALRDVTDQTRAEQAAARARDRLVEALDSLDDGFVLYDGDDRLVLANSRYRAIFDPEGKVATPGARFEDVLRHTATSKIYDVAEADLDTWVDERLRLHRAGGDLTVARLSDGRWLRIEECTTPSGDRVGLRSDITELKRREAELQAAREAAERANSQKTAFVHHLSHELRTPLNAVMGFAQMIADELLGPTGNARYSSYAVQIAEAGGYMLELINNLLDLAKIEAGRFPLTEEVCDLQLVADLILSMVGDRTRKAKVTVTTAFADDAPQLVADPTLLRQMLTNLITNAVKFCRRDGDGRVLVGMERLDDGGLALFVRDNGPGMAPDQIPRALSPFEQLHDRRLTSETGTGLGLPLTRALAELHGGGFVIESALGRGTTAKLLFPAFRVARPADSAGI